MTNEQLLEDLKQFVQATVSQTEVRLETHIDSVETRLSQQISDLDLKVTTIADSQVEQLEDHETRLTRLEPKTA